MMLWNRVAIAAARRLRRASGYGIGAAPKAAGGYPFGRRNMQPGGDR
jgi:hypothetical protein